MAMAGRADLIDFARNLAATVTLRTEDAMVVVTVVALVAHNGILEDGRTGARIPQWVFGPPGSFCLCDLRCCRRLYDRGRLGLASASPSDISNGQIPADFLTRERAKVHSLWDVCPCSGAGRLPDHGRMPVGQSSRLVVSGVGKSFGHTQVLRDVDLTVNAGEIVALTGENGAGKTTLLRICAGVLRADAGMVEVAARIGYCPQSPGLFELLTADEHLVMFGRGIGLPREVALRRGHGLLVEFGFPVGPRVVTADMSGGTRQKLNLALALLADPGLLLLDEPYQGFDRGTYVNFWDHCHTWRSQGKAVIVVTHMLAELDRVDRIVELPAHPSLLGTNR